MSDTPKRLTRQSGGQSAGAHAGARKALQAEVERLRSERARLVEALRPLAVAAALCPDVPDDRIVCHVQARPCRAAAALLAELGELGEGGGA